MSTRRIPSLDGLRAISITLVLFDHLSKWGHIPLRVPSCVGTLGVQVFFVLSGFLITGLLLEEHKRSSTISLREFYIRRAFRIFPAAFSFLIVAIVLYWRDMSWYHIGAAVLYLANMDSARPRIFGHLWSLGIEEQFYLLWPWTLKKWHRYRSNILIAVSLATPLFHVALYAFKVRGGLWGSLPVFADQLAIGCLLAVFAPRLPRVPKYLALAMVAAAALVPFFPANTPARTLFMLFLLRPLLNVSLAGLVLHVIQHPYRALNFAPVSWLGKISYSLYLWQELFCSNPDIHLGFALVIPALLCASLSYYLIEQPMLRIRDRITNSRAARTAVSSSRTPVTHVPFDEAAELCTPSAEAAATVQ